ncbi:MAG: [FeFe] hydrogenase H-cluster radical SAM maturase HydE [Oligoflexia bacterium]|nr:[FeFe] hydrogenase H-cluster radical SAM maturase HydE [Oligoflexia bacterium]
MKTNHLSPLTLDEIVSLLEYDRTRAEHELFPLARKVKEESVGNTVYFRGLIEFSNYCHKNCLYCGLRRENRRVARYDIPDEEILAMARFAREHNYASIVMQSGERSDAHFVERVEKLLAAIIKESAGELRITLSCGEQSAEVYERWYAAGATRYLLRIEPSKRELNHQIHTQDENHSFEKRVECLKLLKRLGYQTGTGVMIGLPGQNTLDLASDLCFFRDLDIHMVGMGPFIEHQETPLAGSHPQMLPLQERLFLALKMVAVLRIMMKDINIAAATALQAIDPTGREQALAVGANVIMPNITPKKYREDYKLYENKPCTDEDPWQCQGCLERRIASVGNTIGYGEFGDSKHYKEQISKKNDKKQKI